MPFKKGLDILQGLAGYNASDPLVIKQEVCRTAEKYVMAIGESRKLPCDYLLVELASNEMTRPLFEAQLVTGRVLEKAVHSHLRQEGCAETEKLQVKIKFVDELPDKQSFRLKWYQREVNARLTVLKGKTDKKFYNLDKNARQIFIGRSSEIVDKHGFIMRHNDIVFKNLEDEINSSISRQHGWLQFDETVQSFRLFDRESKQGTRIERDGKVHKVPPAGETLQDGDLIYSGKGKMRFTLKVNLTEC